MINNNKYMFDICEYNKNDYINNAIKNNINIEFYNININTGECIILTGELNNIFNFIKIYDINFEFCDLKIHLINNDTYNYILNYNKK